MGARQYCVYIMANAYNNVLYTGMTNDLHRRIREHGSGKLGTFTGQYRTTKMVYFECGDDVRTALEREKQIKAGSRQDKIDLINRMNPDWNDLAATYFGDVVK